MGIPEGEEREDRAECLFKEIITVLNILYRLYRHMKIICCQIKDCIIYEMFYTNFRLTTKQKSRAEA